MHMHDSIKQDVNMMFCGIKLSVLERGCRTKVLYLFVEMLSLSLITNFH